MQDSPLPDTWTPRQHLLWGRRLFQHGYYWEAHEAWEHVWLELGRTTADARVVKGLIKLAAAAVKCREGNANGAERHAARAAELLRERAESDLFASMNLAAAFESAQRIAASPPVGFAPPSDQPAILPGLEI